MLMETREFANTAKVNCKMYGEGVKFERIRRITG